MSACLLLYPFQQYLEVSVMFVLAYVQPVQRPAVLGMEMCYWNFLFGEGILIIRLVYK